MRTGGGLAPVLLLVWACSPEGSAEPAATDGDPDTEGASDLPDASGAVESAAPLRRLTRAQYRGVVSQILGVDAFDLSLPADGRVGPFVGNAQTPLSGLHIDQYHAAAMAIAERTDLAALDPCGEAPTDGCVEGFIDRVGAALWRRPVPERDRQGLLAVYQTARAGGDEAAGLRRVLAAVLQSPYMLYHVEIGASVADGAAFRLDGYEVASRLSFLLWNLAPDEALRAAAAEGRLDGPEGIRAEAQRMLEDPRAAEQIGDFHLQWLGAEGLQYLVKDAERYPVWAESDIGDDLRQEIVDFASYIVLQADGTAADLVTVPVAFPRGDVARIYGVVPPLGAPEGAAVGLNPQERSGVLTLAGVLASHASAAETSPVFRGLFVLENLLCVEIAPPPPEVDTSLPEIDPEQPQSRREILALHEQDPLCAACHVQIDPLGLLFEHYDAVGAWRDYDYDYDSDIDTNVVIETPTDVDGPMQTVPELGQALAQSEGYRDCVIRQWVRFSLGRDLGLADRDHLAGLSARVGDDVVVRDLILEIVTSDAFVHRPPHPQN